MDGSRETLLCSLTNLNDIKRGSLRATKQIETKKKRKKSAQHLDKRRGICRRLSLSPCMLFVNFVPIVLVNPRQHKKLDVRARRKHSHTLIYYVFLLTSNNLSCRGSNKFRCFVERKLNSLIFQISTMS